jgi:hypothetical protein
LFSFCSPENKSSWWLLGKAAVFCVWCSLAGTGGTPFPWPVFWDQYFSELFIRSYVRKLPRRTLVYCDPPYFRQSNRLYLNYYESDDHVGLARTIQEHLKRPWLVSYDNVPEIRKFYAKRRCIFCKVQYNAARAYTGTEVFFVSDGLKLPDEASGPWLAGRGRRRALAHPTVI